jgi:hypothetical protein
MSRPVAIVALFLLAGSIAPSVAQSEVDTEVQQYASDAVDWLTAQQVPNSIDSNPYPTRRHLPIGYQIPQNDPVFPYIGRRAYTYDAAISAIALTAAGEYDRAEDLLLALRRLSGEDGRLWFAYNTDNAWPNDEDSAGAVVRTGTVAWAGYAATFYLRMTADEPVTPTDRRLRERILELAERTARYVSERQVLDSKDPRYGMATGGRGSYELELTEDGSVREVYDAERIRWASAEHNIDAFFLFRDLYHLTGEKHYARAAEHVAEGLESLWSEDAGQLIRGIHRDLERDEVLPLDTASWGSMFFAAAGNPDRAREMLSTAESRFRVSRDGTLGYMPYGDSSVYEDDVINDHYFGRPDASWKEVAPIWIEGSLGMAVAHAKLGHTEEALRIVEAMDAYRHRNGGFQYADREVPHQFTTYRSVAATAWYVIAVSVLQNGKVRRLFWSG